MERCTAHYQCAMSAKAGTECIAPALQMLTELDPQATVVSIDGVGACDTISRKAMLEALARMSGGAEALPFVRLFHCNHPSICGRMQKALYTQLHKEREKSKGTLRALALLFRPARGAGSGPQSDADRRNTLRVLGRRVFRGPA